ncbi:MAG: putative rane fusion efflux lipoprotein precursor [Chitinophagaceae bacterium]|nr:putative rane fusion efflux lipoprotein precursor [Chitinophagaceae bacterium]
MKQILFFILLMVFAVRCKEHKKDTQKVVDHKAEIKEQGTIIEFPNDTATLHFFKTETIKVENLSAEFTAPAKVAATIVKSEENSSRNLVLFDNPDLTGSYTTFIQHQININQIANVNIKQKRINLERYKDLEHNGAATGKDVLEAQTALAAEETNLQNEKAAIIEQEATLKLAGFDPQILLKAKAGNIWMICDIPESQINKMKIGSSCKVHFSSIPDETFSGKIEDFGNVVDNLTRMVKMRISLPNSNNRFKAGMFAVVSFGLSEGDLLSVPNTSIVTVQGKNYVFVQKTETQFKRVEIVSGQQINNRIIIFSGLNTGDKVITKGAMQLKGLSFGY